MADAPQMERAWRLALIVDDIDALKVAAAYYAMPRGQRGDMDKLAELSGVTGKVRVALAKLDAAGMLQGNMPKPLEQMINAWVVKTLRK